MKQSRVKIFTAVLVVGFCILLNACAAPGPSELTQQQTSNIKTVSVRSYLGNETVLQYVGDIVTGNKLTKATTDWQLDEYAEKQLTQALKSKFTIRPWKAGLAEFTDTDDYAFNALDKASFWAEPGFHVEPAEYTNKVIEKLKAEATPGYVDAYIIVTTSATGDQISGSNRAIGGYGLFTRKLLFMDPKTSAYSAYQVSVVDGRTLTVLASVDAGLPNDNFDPIQRALRPYLVPFQSLGANISETDIEHMTPGNMELLHNTIFALIDRSLPLTLSRLKLVEVPATDKVQTQK